MHPEAFIWLPPEDPVNLKQASPSLDILAEQEPQTLLERTNNVCTYATSGYVLAPNQTVTFTYYNETPISNTADIELIAGQNYKVSVLGDLIAHASVNVTAS